MIFKAIEINNYGIFKGKHDLYFAQPSIQRVTLIGGLNGSGKTTIFEAIQLVLFGSNSNLHKENKSLSYPKFLKSKINRNSKSSEGVAIKFTINVSDDLDIEEDLTLIRSWKNTTKGIKEHFEVQKNDIVDVDLSENWIEFISQIISPSLSKLFLFDGEKILHYADPKNTSSLLIQGIQTLYGADLVNDLEDDLKILKKRLIKSLDLEANSDIEEIDKEISELKIKIINDEKLLNKDQNKLEEVQKNFESLEKEFEKYGLKKFDKAKELELNMQTLLLEQEDLLKKQRALVAGSMPLNLVKDKLTEIEKKSTHLVKIKNHQNIVQSHEERDKDLLKQVKKLDNKEVYDFIRTTLKKSLKDIKDSLPQGEGSNDYISSSDEHLMLKNEIDNEYSAFQDNQKRLNDLHQKIEQIERSIARIPDTKDSLALFKKRDDFIKLIANLESNIHELTNLIEHSKNEERILTVKYKKAFDLEIDKLQAESVQSKQLQRIKFTENILEKFKNEIVLRSLSSVEELITLKFNYLLRKNSFVDNFSIDKNSFILSAKDAKGKNIELIDLSAGERQILAISILWSLSELSQTNIPVIIDTPLGRLDSKHRHELTTKYFPEAGPQTIVLSTDEEIIGKYYKVFKPYIGKEYLCSENQKSKGNGIIKEGYF